MKDPAGNYAAISGLIARWIFGLNSRVERRYRAILNLLNNEGTGPEANFFLPRLRLGLRRHPPRIW